MNKTQKIYDILLNLFEIGLNDYNLRENNSSKTKNLHIFRIGIIFKG